MSGTQRDAQFTVGSEGFTEQEVLGEITIQALEAADATVIDRTGLGGNEAVRQALEDGEIDLYWEYTATGWLVHLSETRSITDPQKLYEAVAKQDLEENGIRWLPPAPGNDTYAIATNEQTQRDLGVEIISDLAWLVEERPEEATLCFNNDDEDFFAVYNPSLTIRQDTFRQYPQLRDLFAPSRRSSTRRRCAT